MNLNDLHKGVNLQFATSAPRAIAGAATGISGIMVNAVKGPLNKATLVTTLSGYERIFGTASPVGCTSYEQVKAFFADAQTALLYVVRVASDSAAKSSATFQDRQGTPANTLKIEAKNEGTWGDKISVEILDHNILSTTLAGDISIGATSAVLTATGGLEVGSDIQLKEGATEEYRRLIQVDHASKTVYWQTGTTNGFTAAGATVKSMEFTIKVYYNGSLVETHSGLSMNDSVSFFCESVITDDASDYIAVVDLKSTDNDYTDLPAVASVTALTGGADGLSDVDKDDYVGVEANKTGVYAFDNVPGLFRFCCPNPKLTDADPAAAYELLVQAMLDYADGRQTLQFYGDIPYDTSIADAVTFAGKFEGWRLTLFHPWGTASLDNPKWIAPSSAIMGAAVKKDRERGVHKNIGNERLTYFVDLKYHCNVSEGETLNNAGINEIRKDVGRGIITWGGRTQSAELKWRFLDASEYASYIGATLLASMGKYAFEPHHEDTWQRILQECATFLATEQQKGALYDSENPGSPAYALQMDADNNPPDQIAQGIGVLSVAYQKVGTMEKILIVIDANAQTLSFS